MQISQENQLPAFLNQRFKLIRSLGDGSFADVHLVQDSQNFNADGNSVFALKVLKASKFNQVNLNRFEQEFEILAQLKCNHLVKAYELIKEDQSYAILMEAVEGNSLLELITENKLSFNQVESIFNDILEGLQTLHDNGIAHRDIKLENVLIDQKGRAKLTDLGFLKRTSVLEKEELNELLGTVQYLAPEYIKHGHYDFKSDLYSVALMLFECLSGRRWLTGKSPQQTLDYLYEINFEFPKLALSGMPNKFVQVLERGLAMQPWKRFDNARAMRLAILSENGSDQPFVSVNLKESVNIQDVSARRKTQEFLSEKQRRSDKIFFSAVMFLVFLVACALLYFIARTYLQNNQTEIEQLNISTGAETESLVQDPNFEQTEQDLKDTATGDDSFVHFDESAMLPE